MALLKTIGELLFVGKGKGEGNTKVSRFNSDKLLRASDVDSVTENIYKELFKLDAALAPNPLVVYDHTDQFHTGTTAETIIGTPLLIEDDWMGINGSMRVENLFWKTNVATANCTIKQYINTTPDLTGTPVQVTERALNGVTITNGNFFRISNKGSVSANNVFPVASVTSIPYANSSTGITAININFGVAQYLITTVTLANAGDTAGYDFIDVYCYNP